MTPLLSTVLGATVIYVKSHCIWEQHVSNEVQRKWAGA